MSSFIYFIFDFKYLCFEFDFGTFDQKVSEIGKDIVYIWIFNI